MKTSRKLNAMDMIEIEVAFTERMSNELQICVEKMELRIGIKEETLYLFSWERALITDALAMRRKEKAKGRTKIEEIMVSESFMLRMLKNSDDGGKPAA